MAPDSRSCLAAALTALIAGAACSPSPPESPQPAAPAVSVGGEGVAVGTAVAAASAAPAPKPDPWPACTPQMFDAQPGNGDRYSFQNDSDDRYGYRDSTGKVVIEPRFFYAYEFSPEGVAAVIAEEGPLFIAADGQVLAQAFPSDNGPDYFTEGRARVLRSGKVGFIDPSGRVVIEPRYDFASSFCHSRSFVCSGCAEERDDEHAGFVGGRWGMVDRTGREVVPLRYDAVRDHDERHVTFLLDGKPVTLDVDGRPLAPPSP